MTEFTHELEHLLPADLYPDYGPEITTKQPVIREAVRDYLNGPYSNPNKKFAVVGATSYGFEVNRYRVSSGTGVFLGTVNRGVYQPLYNTKGTGVFLPRSNVAVKKTTHRPKIEEEAERQAVSYITPEKGSKKQAERKNGSVSLKTDRIIDNNCA